MKTIAIKCLLIVSGIIVISCTALAVGHAYRLFQYISSQITSPITSILYSIPTILSVILVITATLGIPMWGAFLINEGCTYRGKQ